MINIAQLSMLWVNNTITHNTILTCYGIIRVIVFDNILWFNNYIEPDKFDFSLIKLNLI